MLSIEGESDGPFVRVGQRKVVPADVQLVEEGLGDMWARDPLVVRSRITQNFQALIKPLKERASAQDYERNASY